MALGVLLLAGSVWLGITLQGGADAGATVLVASRDLAAGIPLGPDDLRPVVVSGVSPESYLGSIPEGGVLSGPLGAGELVPVRVVVAVEEDDSVRQVALPVEVARLPPGLARGSSVDIWVTDELGGAVQVLSGAPVVDVSDPEQWAGATATVSVAVPTAEVGAVLSAVRTGAVDVSVGAHR